MIPVYHSRLRWYRVTLPGYILTPGQMVKMPDQIRFQSQNRQMDVQYGTVLSSQVTLVVITAFQVEETLFEGKIWHSLAAIHPSERHVSLVRISLYETRDDSWRRTPDLIPISPDMHVPQVGGYECRHHRIPKTMSINSVSYCNQMHAGLMNRRSP
jgi:hypothetical protein